MSTLAIPRTRVEHTTLLCNQARTMVRERATRIYRQPAGRPEQMVLVLDVSESMRENIDPSYTKLQAACDAAVNFLLEKKSQDRDDEVGVVAFSDEAQAVRPLTHLGRGHVDLVNGVRSLRTIGGTNLDDGLRAAGEILDWNRPDWIPRVLLLTDGLESSADPRKTAEELKARGTVVEVVGVGAAPSKVDEALLREVATTAEGQTRYWFIRDRRTLIARFMTVAAKTRVTS